MRFKRAFLIVLDSFGIGAMPDAAAFGDEGANTIRSVPRRDKFNVPTMANMGLFHIDGVDCKGIDKERQPSAAYCRLAELSMGKDTTLGLGKLPASYQKAPCRHIRMVFRMRSSKNLNARREEASSSINPCREQRPSSNTEMNM